MAALSKGAQKGPKWSTKMFLTIWDPFGPVWTLLDHFKRKMIFCPKAPPPNPTLSFWGNKLIFVSNGTKVSTWAQKGPKLSKTSRLTLLDPFGPLWNVNKPAMFGHFLCFIDVFFWVTLYILTTF